jgi:hypothetical protein
MLEAGRYARGAHAAGGTGMVGSVASGFTALATEAVASRARRVAGIPAARTVEALRERRIARFGDAHRQIGPGAASGIGAASRASTTAPVPSKRSNDTPDPAASPVTGPNPRSNDDGPTR